MKLTLRLLTLRLRQHDDTALVMMIEQGTHFPLMVGSVSTETAERLAEAFENAGVKIDRGELEDAK